MRHKSIEGGLHFLLTGLRTIQLDPVNDGLGTRLMFFVPNLHLIKIVVPPGYIVKARRRPAIIGR